MQQNARGWHANNGRNQYSQQREHWTNRFQRQPNHNPHQQQGAPFTIGLKHAVCPRCTRGYDLRRRVPIILHCNHNVCKECVQALNAGAEIKCILCERLSGKRDKTADVADKFETNYYLAGQLYFSKRTIDNQPPGASTCINYTTEITEEHDIPKTVSSASTTSRKCSAEACTRESSLWCADCIENYCEPCSHRVHNSAKGLKSHKVLSIGGVITICEKHNLPRDITCNTCDGKNYCSNCFIDDHNGHSLRRNTDVDESDIPRLKTLMEECKAVLKNLRDTDKKVNKQMKASNQNKINILVSRCFSTIHSKLQKIESKWNGAIADQFKDSQQSMQKIRENLRDHVSGLSDLLIVAKNLTEKKQDFKRDVTLVLAQLENARKLSYEFKSNTFSPEQDIELFLDSCMKCLDQLTSECMLEMNKPPELIPAEPLLINKTVSEVDSIISNISKCSISKEGSQDSSSQKNDIVQWITSVSQSVGASDKESSKSSGIKLNKKENVIITHIENPDCVYINLRKHAKKVDSLHKDLAGFVSRFIAGSVTTLETGNLYLVRSYLPNQPNWCRARLIEYDKLQTEKHCQVFYIDFGTEAKVNVTDIRQLPDISKGPSFAYKCRIKDIFPVSGNWEKQTNKLITEILTGSHVLMVVFGEKSGTLEVDFIAYDDTSGETSLKTTLLLTGNALSYDHYDVEYEVQENRKSNQPMFYNGLANIYMQQHYDVVISHVNNPDSFFVQLKDHRQKLEILITNMSEHYKRIKKGFIYTPKLGKSVAVKLKVADYDQWYRGTIVDILKGKGIVSVFLVDTGKIVSVQWDHLRKLSEDFYTTVTLAIHVKLKDIKMCAESQTWSDASINHLLTYIDESRVLKMIPYSFSKEKFDITLFEMYSREHICINSWMVSNGLAVSTGHLSLVTIFPCGESEEELPEMFTVDLIKKSQGGGGTHEDSDDDEDYSDFKFMPVKVLHVKSPACIYVHFPEEKTLKDKLEEFQMNIQLNYIKTPLETQLEWTENALAVAYNVEDRQYYRVQVEEKLPGDMYRVFSRDFAFFFTCGLDKIGRMDEFFLTQPPFAYKCHVSGIKPIGKSWSLTATDFLKDLLMNKRNLFFAKTGNVDKNTLTTPALFCFKTCKPPSALEPAVNKIENINKQLAMNGLAISIKEQKRVVPKKLNWYEESVRESIRNVVEVRRNEDVYDRVAVSSSIDLFNKQAALSPSELKFNEVLPENLSDNDIHVIKQRNDWLPPMAILKTEFSAVVTYVDERAYIYFHYISEIDTLNRMAEILTMHFSVTPSPSNHVFEIGDRCSVRYRDGKWYRGILLEFSPDTEEFKVCMIDYGNIEEVVQDDLHREVAFPNIPSLAKRIQLNEVYPISGTFNTSEIDVLHKLLVDFEISVKIVDNTRIPFSANVYKNQLDVNKFMVTDLLNCSNKILLPQPNISLEEDVIIEDESSSYVQAELPKDKKFSITLINVLNHGQVIFEFNEVKENPAKFKKLSDVINNYGEQQPPLFHIQLDQPCIAKFSEDEQWYRGKVFKILKDQVIVLFVDYGNLEAVERNDIRSIKPEWLILPLVHYIARVNYFKDLDDNDDSNELALKHFSEYYDQEKRALVVNDNPLTIDIYEVNEDVLSYASLIEKGVFD